MQLAAGFGSVDLVELNYKALQISQQPPRFPALSRTQEAAETDCFAQLRNSQTARVGADEAARERLSHSAVDAIRSRAVVDRLRLVAAG